MKPDTHQYIERETGRVYTERLYQDALVRFFYGAAREKAPRMFRLLTDRRTSHALGYLNYDTRWGSLASRRFLRASKVDLDECLDDPESLDTARKVFERRLRYWQCRPAPDDDDAIVSPADARVIVGSLEDASLLFLKGRFFDYEELLGADEAHWIDRFRGADYAIFRLTPDKYHYNHTPVAGVVEDFYDIEGAYHSCNPRAVISIVTPYSKNRRVVTIINTDVPGGSGVGLVAMIEVVALMIGDIRQCYSDRGYENPRVVEPGMFVERGRPKSLFRPGSSTTVLLFQKNRVRFAGDLVANQQRYDVRSRFSLSFHRPLVETDVKVRSLIGHNALLDERRV
jgi:phosphatidylserine decarboxylase